MEIQVDTLETHVGPRKAMVVSPSSDVVVGHARLEELRAARRGSEIDHRVLSAARATKDAHLLVFRGQSDSTTARYRIDPELGDDEARELVYGLVRTQLPTYRRLVAAGMAMLVHTGFELRDCALFKEQTEALRVEISAGPQDARTSLDSWILQHMTFFYTAPYPRLRQDSLPGVLPLVERRRPQLEQRLAALGPGALGAEPLEV